MNDSFIDYDRYDHVRPIRWTGETLELLDQRVLPFTVVHEICRSSDEVADAMTRRLEELPGMADQFYRQQVEQHLRIGLRAIARLRQQTMGRLHSRKLRSFDEVAFQ